MSLNLFEHVWPPETLIDGGESVVDARMSFFVVKLDESLKVIFLDFEHLANSLAILAK